MADYRRTLSPAAQPVSAAAPSVVPRSDSEPDESGSDDDDSEGAAEGDELVIDDGDDDDAAATSPAASPEEEKESSIDPLILIYDAEDRNRQRQQEAENEMHCMTAPVIQEKLDDLDITLVNTDRAGLVVNPVGGNARIFALTFKNCRFETVSFTNCVFKLVIFQDCTFRNVTFINSVFEELDCFKVGFSNCHWENYATTTHEQVFDRQYTGEINRDVVPWEVRDAEGGDADVSSSADALQPAQGSGPVSHKEIEERWAD